MKQIKPLTHLRDINNRDEIDESDQYFMVENDDGVLKCSCGRNLVAMDDNTFMCTGGFPTYSLADGEVILDKFGNIMLKNKPHGDKKE